MGRPYLTELETLHETYNWALSTDIDALVSSLKDSIDLPLIAVGSGGSITAAEFLVRLHCATGKLATNITPFELRSSQHTLRQSSVTLLSAGGNNTDILAAFKHAAISESQHLTAICMRLDSRLAALSKEFTYSRYIGFNPPFQKDGFLATNSLLAFVTLLSRAYQEIQNNHSTLLPSLSQTKELLDSIQIESEVALKRDTWLILFGGWGSPAAVDLESKLSEAALAHALLSDYRNFAHGRHHWLAKRAETAAIIALTTPDEEDIASRTLSLIPSYIPRLTIATGSRGAAGAIDLLSKSLHLVHLLGLEKNIDPGRPGVPEFGRKIYHLRSTVGGTFKSIKGMTTRSTTAILRKSGVESIDRLSDEEVLCWSTALKNFLSTIESTAFGSIVMDYDGTMCDPASKFLGPDEKVIELIVQFLRHDVTIGIATGRGKSANAVLRNLIPKQFWEAIQIGYYNGGCIRTLAEEGPQRAAIADDTLDMYHRCIRENSELLTIASIEPRALQITIEPTDAMRWARVRDILLGIKCSQNIFDDIRILESSHSIDILPKGVSKLAVVEQCSKIAESKLNPASVLCFGDKGNWPGNDYQLLSTRFSLSVDQVSPDPTCCWNLAEPGFKGTQALKYYLHHLHPDHGLVRYKSKTVFKGIQ